MSKRNSAATLALLMAITLAAGDASAGSVDFRTATYTVGGPNPDGATVAELVDDGVTWRIESQPAPGSTLFFDPVFDGFGVRYDYEVDEIEADESLVVSFLDAANNPVAVNLLEIHITDFFFENGYLERGWYDLSNDGVQTFITADPGQSSWPASNGDLYISLNETVTSISFGAFGRINHQNHEFSVAGLSTQPIPEPSAALLFAVGGVVVARASRSRTRAA